MAETKARQIASLIDNSGDVKSLHLDNVSNASGIVGTQVYATPALLPTTGLSSGDQAFVTSNQRLYITNGSGWYNVALINATPTFTTGPNATYNLSNDLSPTIITLVAQDSDGQPITYSATDSGMTGIATLSQDSSVFTVTPLTDSAGGTIGTFTLTFQATDGIGITSALSTFTLAFGPDWSNTPTVSKIVASDALAGDVFGAAVELSGDGNYAIVGAQYGDKGATTNTGAAYIYLRSESTWTQQAKITASNAGASDQFGKNGVSLNSDATYAMVGAPTEDTGAGNAGMVYVYTRSGTNWSQQTTLQASDASGGGAKNFGDSVSLNSDATYAAIGASGDPGSTSNEGAVYIFTRSGSTWTQQAKLVASDRAQSQRFGIPVSMNNDGSYVIIGAYGDSTNGTSSGAAYIFSRSGSTWTQQQKIVSNDPSASNPYFGWDASINDDGSYAVVSKYSDNSNTGAAYVFTRSGSTWTQQAKLTASAAAAGDRFAYSVSISRNASYILVGAIGDYNITQNVGEAYIFKRSGSTWSQQTKLTASDAQNYDNFGWSASMSDDGAYALIGSHREDGGSGDPKADAGAAYIYKAE